MEDDDEDDDEDEDDDADEEDEELDALEMFAIAGLVDTITLFIFLCKLSECSE